MTPFGALWDPSGTLRAPLHPLDGCYHGIWTCPKPFKPIQFHSFPSRPEICPFWTSQDLGIHGIWSIDQFGTSEMVHFGEVWRPSSCGSISVCHLLPALWISMAMALWAGPWESQELHVSPSSPDPSKRGPRLGLKGVHLGPHILDLEVPPELGGSPNRVSRITGFGPDCHFGHFGQSARNLGFWAIPR